MKVKATITIVTEYVIDPLHYSYCGKDIMLEIEKKEFCNHEALINLLDSDSDIKITAEVEEVKE